MNEPISEQNVCDALNVRSECNNDKVLLVRYKNKLIYYCGVYAVKYRTSVIQAKDITKPHYECFVEAVCDKLINEYPLYKFKTFGYKKEFIRIISHLVNNGLVTIEIIQ